MSESVGQENYIFFNYKIPPRYESRSRNEKFSLGWIEGPFYFLPQTYLFLALYFTACIFAGTKDIFLSPPHVSEGSGREQRLRARDDHLAVRSSIYRIQQKYLCNAYKYS